MRFRVNGLPAPQGSKRHVGGGRMVESSRAVGPWREAVRAECQRQREHEQSMGHEFEPDYWTGGTLPALSVTVVFVLKRPAGHYRTGVTTRHLLRESAPRYPAGRPDVDKLCRAVLDGLVMGGVMADDAQVVSLSAAKVYANGGQAPGAIIEVEAMT